MHSSQSNNHIYKPLRLIINLLTIFLQDCGYRQVTSSLPPTTFLVPGCTIIYSFYNKIFKLTFRRMDQAVNISFSVSINLFRSSIILYDSRKAKRFKCSVECADIVFVKFFSKRSLAFRDIPSNVKDVTNIFFRRSVRSLL